jgi:hypothetical protein
MFLVIADAHGRECRVRDERRQVSVVACALSGQKLSVRSRTLETARGVRFKGA